MATNRVVMKVDMGPINDLIGTGFALDDIGRQSAYIMNLINASYYHANQEFNREVVAFAQTTDSLGHMFEWGTRGINTSRSNMRPDPFTERARLWNNHFHNGRKLSIINYTYKPSVGNVPKPTSRKTGIPGDVLKRLQYHVFWNKAMVMEEGIPVTIKPKPENESQLLFVPNIWKGEKGYSMYPRNTNPDISHTRKGTFTAYWSRYWMGPGMQDIQARAEAAFVEDFTEVMRKQQAKQAGNPTLTSNAPAKQKARIQRAQRTVRKYLERAAQERIAREAKRYPSK